jgi:hypothetical protein
MDPRYSIVPALPQHIAALAAIERAAAVLLQGHAPASILAETTTLDDLAAGRAAGRRWVGRDDDRPGGVW